MLPVSFLVLVGYLCISGVVKKYYTRKAVNKATKNMLTNPSYKPMIAKLMPQVLENIERRNKR